MYFSATNSWKMPTRFDRRYVSLFGGDATGLRAVLAGSYCRELAYRRLAAREPCMGLLILQFFERLEATLGVPAKAALLPLQASGTLGCMGLVFSWLA